MSSEALEPEGGTPEPTPPPPVSRRRAIAEVVLCSGYPTQLLVVLALTSLGMRPIVDGTLSPQFVILLSGIDTVLLLSLIFLFLRESHEQPARLFVGRRPLASELTVGVLLVPLLFVVVIAVQLAIRAAAPALRNVETNPFASLLGSPVLLAMFVALVLIAGGLREELQRAFLLHRFEQRLGGPRVGIVVTSVGFGLGHTLQGWDAAIVTGLMGALWAALYVSRRSVVANITSHALFNVVQVVAGYVTIARA